MWSQSAARAGEASSAAEESGSTARAASLLPNLDLRLFIYVYLQQQVCSQERRKLVLRTALTSPRRPDSWNSGRSSSPFPINICLILLNFFFISPSVSSNIPSISFSSKNNPILHLIPSRSSLSPFSLLKLLSSPTASAIYFSSFTCPVFGSFLCVFSVPGSMRQYNKQMILPASISTQ